MKATKMNTNMMTAKSLTRKKMEVKTFDELSKTEQICLYLHDHPEVLTEELMTEVAARYMNYAHIRYMIKQMFSQILLDNVKNDNIVIIPDHYEEESEKERLCQQRTAHIYE